MPPHAGLAADEAGALTRDKEKAMKTSWIVTLAAALLAAAAQARAQDEAQAPPPARELAALRAYLTPNPDDVRAQGIVTTDLQGFIGTLDHRDLPAAAERLRAALGRTYGEEFAYKPEDCRAAECPWLPLSGIRPRVVLEAEAAAVEGEAANPTADVCVLRHVDDRFAVFDFFCDDMTFRPAPPPEPPAMPSLEDFPADFLSNPDGR